MEKLPQRRKSIYDNVWAGDYFEGILVLEKLWFPNSGHYGALFKCHCNKTFIRAFNNIKRGAKGCKDCEAAKRRESKLYIKDRRLYGIWKCMNSRCHNIKSSNYKSYGGRGIHVCEDWRDTNSKGFENFYLQMGIYPTTNHTLDRIDVNVGYSPDNCRWVTMKVQANNKTDNHFVEWKGVKYTIQGLGEELGIKPNTLLYRLRRGWSIDEAVSGVKVKLWSRPLRNLSDEEFNTLLIRYFKGKEKCYPLARYYNIDSGNLHRVLRREDIIKYYKENLGE